jgi:hypothetical protein
MRAVDRLMKALETVEPTRINQKVRPHAGTLKLKRDISAAHLAPDIIVPRLAQIARHILENFN